MTLPILPDTLILPEKTISGRGSLASLFPECCRFERRGIVVHGTTMERGGQLSALLSNAPRGMALQTVRHRGDEPTLRQVSELVEAARLHQAGWIAAVCGASV